MSLIALAVIAGLLLFILLAYQVLLWNRPPRTDHTELVFQGVTYTRQARSIPRPLVVHAVEIDLSAPGIAFLVTPGDASKGMEVLAATTSEFVAEFGVQVAINGSFFEPFHSQGYTDYYPHTGDPVDVRGLAISNGVTYSADEASYAKLCLADAYAQITAASCPSDTTQALAGDHMIVEGGRRGDLGPPGRPDALHPRTAVAVDAEGKSLWLIVEYQTSDGATILVEIEAQEEGFVPKDVAAKGVLRGEQLEAAVLKVQKGFGEAMDTVRHSAETIIEKVRGLSDPPDEMEVTFGIKAAGELGNFAIAKAEAEANYTIKLVWKREAKKKRAGKGVGSFSVGSSPRMGR